MAGTVIADKVQAASTSTLEIMNGVASAPPRIEDSAGTEIGTFCRAWVNFNGTGTVAIRSSFNVTSITDNGVGDYTINFTTAMPDANYSFALSSTFVTNGTNATAIINPTTTAPTSAALRVVCLNVGSTYDSANVCVTIFR
jgi:hypothetical protein